MIQISMFNLCSLVLLTSLFAYVLGIVIRGIAAERAEDYFRQRFIDLHQAAIREKNHLKKDLLNEMEVRKAAEQLAGRRLREIEALQAHMPKPFTGGKSCLEEHVVASSSQQSNGELEKDDRAA